MKRLGPRVEICGGIASGKTTLAKALGALHAKVVLENFRKNPFWRYFFENPAENSFETELVFLLQHYHDIRQSQRGANRFVCDFSLLLDQAYSDVVLSGERRRIFDRVAREVEKEILSPTVIIHLVCPIRILLQRIQSRNRQEEQFISSDYLKRLSAAIDRRIAVARKQVKVITIDSHAFDFRVDITPLRDKYGDLFNIK